MNKFWDIIVDLLQTKDCVILPGFGAFVANYKSAYYNPTTHMMYPPSRSFIFNDVVNNNDGLVQSRLGQRLNLSYDESGDLLQEEIQLLNDAVENHGRFEVRGLGHFFINQSGSLVFENDSTALVGAMLKGYYPITLKPIEQNSYVARNSVSEQKSLAAKSTSTSVEPNLEKTIPEKVTPAKEKKVSPQLEVVKGIQPDVKSEIEEIAPSLAEKGEQEEVFIKQKSSLRKNVWRGVRVAAAVLPLVAFSWFLNDSQVTSGASVTLADLNPFADGPKAYEPGDSYLDEYYQRAEDLFGEEVKVESVEISTKEVTPSQEKVIESVRINKITSTKTSDLDYQLIIGCFRDESNAKDKVSQVAGSYILDYHKGLYRVSGGGASNKSESQAKSRQLKSSGVDNWVLVK